MINSFVGDLLSSHCNIICHQVNCKGVMGSGVAKQVREQFPRAYEVYSTKYVNCTPTLGTLDVVPCGEKTIINMYAQDDYGYGKRQTNYEAFYRCLEAIKNSIQFPKTDIIGFPYKIGCDRGGASWKIIHAMIQEVLKDYNVEIYRLEGVPYEAI